MECKYVFENNIQEGAFLPDSRVIKNQFPIKEEQHTKSHFLLNPGEKYFIYNDYVMKALIR